jgi:hypothetical protein
VAKLIAIGRPGEELPPLGAARLYVSNDDWQPVVTALSRQSEGVLLHYSENQGTLWEWRHCLQNLDRTRVVLYVPITGRSQESCEAQYQKLARTIENLVGFAVLPECWDASRFIYFPSADSRAQWLLKSSAIPDNHPISPILKRFAKLRLGWRTEPLILWIIVLPLLLFALSALLGVVLSFFR